MKERIFPYIGVVEHRRNCFTDVYFDYFGDNEIYCQVRTENSFHKVGDEFYLPIDRLVKDMSEINSEITNTIEKQF